MSPSMTQHVSRRTPDCPTKAPSQLKPSLPRSHDTHLKPPPALSPVPPGVVTAFKRDRVALPSDIKLLRISVVNHSLSPVMAIPFTNHFCPKRKRIRMGRTLRTDPAMSMSYRVDMTPD
jgi:hypothetical protein